MKTFLIVYAILALLFYIFILAFSLKDAAKANKIFRLPVVHVSMIKLIGISLVFPLVIATVIISVLIDEG